MKCDHCDRKAVYETFYCDPNISKDLIPRNLCDPCIWSKYNNVATVIDDAPKKNKRKVFK